MFDNYLGCTVKVHVVDLATEEVKEPITVRAYLQQTVADLKQIIAQHTGLEEKFMRIVLQKYLNHNDLKLLLTTDEKSLKTEGFYKSHKVNIVKYNINI